MCKERRYGLIKSLREVEREKDYTVKKLDGDQIISYSSTFLIFID